MQQDIRIETANGVSTLTIDRPDVRNAISLATGRAIANALTELEQRDDVGVLIVTGSGDRVFAAGANLNEMSQWGRDEGLRAAASSLCSALERFQKPTIAAVNGVAFGGGCELALACDLRVAAAHAKFGQPEVGLGVIPSAGGTQRLPRVVGLGRAKHMILTGEAIDAETALAWGLVSAVVPAGELQTTAQALAQKLLCRGPLALRLAKLALNLSSRVDVDTGLVVEALAQSICFESPEKREGLAAFLTKRSPAFR